MVNFDAFTKDSEIVKKLLIGSLLALTGIGMLAVLGWMLEIMRRIQADDETLPDFDDIGTYFIDGLKATGVGIIWSLPLVVIVLIMSVGSVFAPALFASEEDAAIAIVLISFCVFGLTLIYVIPMLALMIPSMGVLSETGSIREAINFSKILELFRANLGGFFIAGLLGMLINSLLSTIGTLLCLIGIYPAFVISYGIQGQLFGKAYQDAKLNLTNMI